MAARLKVFVTSDGLTDYVVATSSKPKALAAWGIHQDLFKTGLAHETDDAALVKAAVAQPGEVLRRPAGTRGELAKVKAAKAPKPKAPSKAALKRVSDLEAQIAAVAKAYDAAAAALAKRRAALDREAAALDARRKAEAARLDQRLTAARKAVSG